MFFWNFRSTKIQKILGADVLNFKETKSDQSLGSTRDENQKNVQDKERINY